MSYAIYFYTNGLKMSEEIGDRSGISNNLTNLAIVHFNLNNLDKALLYGVRSLEVAKSVDYPMLIADAANILAKIYYQKGEYKLAFEITNVEIESKERYRKIENQKSIIRYQFKSEFDKKELVANKEIQKQKIIRNSTFGALAVVLIFAFVFFIQRNNIKKGKKLSDELLLNILPSEVAEELKLKGEVNAQNFEEVTVLFTDSIFAGRHTRLGFEETPKIANFVSANFEGNFGNVQAGCLQQNFPLLQPYASDKQ